MQFTLIDRNTVRRSLSISSSDAFSNSISEIFSLEQSKKFWDIKISTSSTALLKIDLRIFLIESQYLGL
jgi:hypothetical protein